MKVIVILAMCLIAITNSNSVYHWYDWYYDLPEPPAPGGGSVPSPEVFFLGDLIQEAVEAGTFKTLVQMVSDLGLDDPLRSIINFFSPASPGFFYAVGSGIPVPAFL